jgi:GSH-dependent disulfide-bond oxidoreductase
MAKNFCASTVGPADLAASTDCAAADRKMPAARVRAITFASPAANAIDLAPRYGDIHATASIFRCPRNPIHSRNAQMIDLYYWTTPNGHKITMFLEETGLTYKIFPINIGKGDQFKPEFLAIAPNNRIPAMVDHEPKGGGKPISIFESGAMLLYLAEKTGKFLPAGIHGRYDAIQWTFWQMGGLGPMAGQNHHFSNYAQEKIKYAIDRYVNETNRLYGVLNKRLADREFIAGDYSIADMASYPWVVPYKNQSQNIDDFPHLKRWLETIRERPATLRAYAKAKEVNPNYGQPSIRTEEERKLLFGQTAAVVK